MLGAEEEAEEAEEGAPAAAAGGRHARKRLMDESILRAPQRSLIADVRALYRRRRAALEGERTARPGARAADVKVGLGVCLGQAKVRLLCALWTPCISPEIPTCASPALKPPAAGRRRPPAGGGGGRLRGAAVRHAHPRRPGPGPAAHGGAVRAAAETPFCLLPCSGPCACCMLRRADASHFTRHLTPTLLPSAPAPGTWRRWVPPAARCGPRPPTARCGARCCAAPSPPPR